MAVQSESPAEEIRRLRHCINDLLSILALPATWTGGAAPRVAGNFLDALVSMLSLDFVYARLSDHAGGSPTEMVRIGPAWEGKPQPKEIGRRLRTWLETRGDKGSPVATISLEERDVALVPLPLGLHGEMGIIVAGSGRLDFPQQTERLVLHVAANQAAVGLQESQLLTDERRNSSDLEQRVVQRTAELATINDELSKAHVQVIQGEERWRSVFENSAIGVALTDLNGRFVAANPVYQKMLGYTEEELGQLRFLDVTVEEDRNLNSMLVEQLLEGKRRLAEEALNETRSELAHMTRVTTLSTLTASIAHEVNQPLSGIVTNAGTCLRMLDANPPNVEGARETARRTIRDGNRASEVITRLRALFSKKNAAFELFDLNEATTEVVALSVSELQRNRVILQSDLAVDLPSVLGDQVQIQQVVLNLLRNGSDAMITVDDRPRDLLIKTECDDSGGVRLSVKDSGVGIDSETEEKLFKAFYTTKSDGMGIGLSVSRSIIQQHQGRLWAIRNVGPGATFMFSIPRSTDT